MYSYAAPPLLDFTSWRTSTFHSVLRLLTSSQYSVLSSPYQSVSWQFITLWCTTWCSPLSFPANYVTLTHLISRLICANPGIPKVAWAFHWGFAPCSVVHQHPPAAFQSESQQCWINEGKQRNEEEEMTERERAAKWANVPPSRTLTPLTEDTDGQASTFVRVHGAEGVSAFGPFLWVFIFSSSPVKTGQILRLNHQGASIRRRGKKAKLFFGWAEQWHPLHADGSVVTH